MLSNLNVCKCKVEKIHQKRRGVAFEFSEKEALPLTHKFSTIPIYKEKPWVGLIDLNFKSILKRTEMSMVTDKTFFL